jgi:repressor of nif and glnA expression
VYQFIETNGNRASFAQVANHCEDHGYMTTTSRLKRMLHKMIEARILNKNGDDYTNRRVCTERGKSRLSHVL